MGRGIRDQFTLGRRAGGAGTHPSGGRAVSKLCEGGKYDGGGKEGEIEGVWVSVSVPVVRG